MNYDFDLFVIGAGSGGVSAARRVGKEYGAKVGIAERDLVGGTCVIRGCVPKKLMVYASKFAHLYTDALGYGWSPVTPEFDWAKLTKAVHEEVMRLNGIYKNMLSNSQVELFEHSASFIDPHTLQVGDRKITAKKILIAVGGEAVKLDIPGKEHCITSREIFNLPQQPKRMLVVGAGYIAVEFAGIMHGLGTEVTHAIRGERFLRGFDIDIQNSLYDAVIQRGIKVLTGCHITKITKQGDALLVAIQRQGEDITVETDAVLMAIGRAPLLGGLGLDKAKVKVVLGKHYEDLPKLDGYTPNSAIKVNSFSRTSQPHIFAVGDCTNRINLTPVAIAEGRAFADTEFGGKRRAPNHSNVPSAVFSQPEAASVGLTEAEARQKLGDDRTKIFKSTFRPMFNILAGSQEKALIKLIVDAKTDKVLGAHMVGDNAAEIMQGIAIAIKMGATKKQFDATVGIHPSAAEEFVTLR